MMPYIYLILCVLTSASSSILGKIFNKKSDGAEASTEAYNFFQLTSIFLCWGLLYAFDLTFEFSVLWYSLLFAICYTVCNICLIKALKYGPAMLTSLFIGLSLILTTIWGFIFWDASLSVFVIIGIIFVAVSIYLCLYTGKKDEKGFSWRWLVYVLLAFVGNAGGTITQRTQQVEYNGQYGNMLMFFATMLSALICAIIYFKKNKSTVKAKTKHIFGVPVIAGVCNVMLNVFVIMLATSKLSSSLIYPVIGVGGIGVVVIFSLLVFKERMYWWQWIGIGMGSIAIALLSI